MEQCSSAPRNHSREQELSSIEERVRSRMDQVYGQDSFEQASRVQQEQVVKQVVDQHIEETLAQTAPLGNPFAGAREQKRAEEIILGLDPDDDDVYIGELLALIQDIGVLPTLKAIEKTANFHIKDDLHRALVAYIHKGYPVGNLPEHDPIRAGLEMTLFELYLPVINDEQEQHRELKQLRSSM